MNGGERGQPDAIGPAEPAATLDAYVDGLMSPAQRAAFERRLSMDPALADELSAQRKLERYLTGMFVVPPFVGLPTNSHPAPDSAPTDPGASAGNGAATNTAAAAAAAAISVRRALPYNLILGSLAAVIVTCVSWLAYNTFADPRRSFEEVYYDAATACQTPGSCGSGVDGTAADADPTHAGQIACAQMLGGLATLKKLPTGIEIIGVDVEPVLSKNTLVMRAKVDGRDVVVFAEIARNVDPSAAKNKVGRRAGGLNVFLRQGNGLLLYEMTPFDRPRMLDLYEFPPAPEQVGRATNHARP